MPSDQSADGTIHRFALAYLLASDLWIMTYFRKNPWSFGDSSPLQWTQALFRIVAVLCALFVFGTNSAYSQSSPPNSDQAKRIQMLVDRAAELVNAKGKEAFSEFRQRGSEWFSGDTYIFAYAPDGTVVLNPAFPAREGHAYHGEKDKKGKAFHDEIIKTAETKGSGWVDYWLPKPGQSEPSQKWSYVKAVKAEGVAVVGAGFFPE